MGNCVKKTVTKPLPAGAETFTRKGQRLARWRDAKGKTRTSAGAITKCLTHRSNRAAGWDAG